MLYPLFHSHRQPIRNHFMKFIIILLFPFKAFTQSVPVLFQNVNIIDVRKGSMIANQHVLVEGSFIKKISSKPLKIKEAKVIDGTGKYLMPGLCDFNASVMLYESNGSPAFMLMLAYGVTSVKDLLPPIQFAKAKQLKEQIANGSILGPRLYLPGQTLVDRKPTNNLLANANSMITVKTVSEAVAMVDSLIAWGADIIDARNIKSDSILRAITKTAHKHNRKVIERMTGDWMTASNAGVDAFTHLSDLRRTTTTGRQKLFQIFQGDSVISDTDFYNRVLPSLGGVDTVYFNTLMKALKKNNTWLCTGTTSYFPSLNRFEHGDTSRNVYRTKRQKQLMENDLKVQSSLTAVDKEQPDMSQLYMAHKRGLPIIAGTQLNGKITPGISMHDMLFWLVDGGFTPADAIRAATLNPAVFIGKEKELGTVEQGKIADLILLDANPLKDINNTRKINAVVANGKLLLRNDIDKMLEQAKDQASRAK